MQKAHGDRETEKPVAVEVSDVAASYNRGPDILQGVSVQFRDGEITCIIGPNGAGKSTLLRAVFGLKVKITRGTVRLYNDDITNEKPYTLLQKGLVLIPQGKSNFPLMTVRENLEMGAFIRRDAGVKSDIEGVLDQFPVLREKERELAGNLSGGQQQLMEIARALLLHPRVVLLDEPSLGLAPQVRRFVFDAIAGLRERSITVLLVEQNATMALAIADHAVVLELGRKRFEGTGCEIAASAEVKRLYLGGCSDKERDAERERALGGDGVQGKAVNA